MAEVKPKIDLDDDPFAEILGDYGINAQPKQEPTKQSSPKADSPKIEDEFGNFEQPE